MDMKPRHCLLCIKQIPKPKNMSWKRYQTKKFCSRLCFTKYHHEEIECPICLKKFIQRKFRRGKYCSKACSQQKQVGISEHVCFLCHNSLLEERYRWGRKYYCLTCFDLKFGQELVRCHVCGLPLSNHSGKHNIFDNTKKYSHMKCKQLSNKEK